MLMIFQKKINDIESEDFEYKNSLSVVTDQLELMMSKKRVYSNNFILNSFFIYSYSKSVYNLIRSNNILILPNPIVLQRLSSFQNIGVKDDDSNLNYLKLVLSKLSEKEKNVNLQIDEIYTKKQLSYIAKCLYGFAENRDGELAKTVLGFMINSVYGHMKEIVSLIPVSNISGEELNDYTKNIIYKLQSIGFKIISISSDNHKINRKSNDIFSSEISFKNPDYNYELIFLIFDSVLIYKNIYNNWVNRKDYDKSFCIPNFDNTKILFSCFRDLREIYKLEANALTKRAYKLNITTLYPSSIDKQKVQLALNVFHESTTASLISYNNPDYEGTIEFLKIINRWWSIVSTIITFKGVIKRNDYGKIYNNN